MNSIDLLNEGLKWVLRGNDREQVQLSLLLQAGAIHP